MSMTPNELAAMFKEHFDLRLQQLTEYGPTEILKIELIYCDNDEVILQDYIVLPKQE